MTRQVLQPAAEGSRIKKLFFRLIGFAVLCLSIGAVAQTAGKVLPPLSP
jgi:hypothetical protein